MKNSPPAVASATYRKVVNEIAEVLDNEPTHTRYPASDFEKALADIPDAIKEKALEWYVRGIERGMAKATDLMASGDIYVKNETVFAPKKIKLNLQTKFKGGEWNPLKISIKSSDIGFE